MNTELEISSREGSYDQWCQRLPRGRAIQGQLTFKTRSLYILHRADSVEIILLYEDCGGEIALFSRGAEAALTSTVP